MKLSRKHFVFDFVWSAIGERRDRILKFSAFGLCAHGNFRPIVTMRTPWSGLQGTYGTKGVFSLHKYRIINEAAVHVVFF